MSLQNKITKKQVESCDGCGRVQGEIHRLYSPNCCEVCWALYIERGPSPYRYGGEKKW